MNLNFFNSNSKGPFSELVKTSDLVAATSGIDTYDPGIKEHIIDYNQLEEQLNRVLANATEALKQGNLTVEEVNHLIVFFDQKILTKDIARNLNARIEFPFTFELIPVSQLKNGQSIEVEFWTPTYRRMLSNGQLISKTFRCAEYESPKEAMNIIFEKIEAVLKMTGQDFSNIMHVRIELPENGISDLKEVDKAYKKKFGDQYPVRSVYAGLDSAFSVKITYKDTEF